MTSLSVISGFRGTKSPEPMNAGVFRLNKWPIEPSLSDVVFMGSRLAASRRPGMTGECDLVVPCLLACQRSRRNAVSGSDTRPCSPGSRAQEQDASRILSPIWNRPTRLVRRTRNSRGGYRPREGHQEMAATMEGQFDRGEQSRLGGPLFVVGTMNLLRHSGASRSEEPGTHEHDSSGIRRRSGYKYLRGVHGFRARASGAPRNDSGAWS